MHYIFHRCNGGGGAHDLVSPERSVASRRGC